MGSCVADEMPPDAVAAQRLFARRMRAGNFHRAGHL
jgi:hypothetical protein